MEKDNKLAPWSIASFTRIEAGLWEEDINATIDASWLDASWQDPVSFLKALHSYSERRQACSFKSIPFFRYDFYYDLIVRHKVQTTPAYMWLDNDVWRTWTYAELGAMVNGIVVSWEDSGVEPGDSLTILHPQGPYWIIALLAGLRLGAIISILPPQGNAFVSRRLKNIKPKWLAIDHLYRHQLEQAWQDKVLPNTISSLQPSRVSYEYLSNEIVIQSFDPTNEIPDAVCSVDANTFYLGALRDGIFALGIKQGQKCAAPGWYELESQPSMILSVLLHGGTWVHAELSEIEKQPERLLDQQIEVIGISKALRDVLQRNPPIGDKNWRYWFRHPAESADFTVWQNFIRELKLETSYSGNLICNTAKGGGILFSSRVRGHAHYKIFPGAGLCWQIGIVNSPALPSLNSSGRLALGKEKEDKIIWAATPYLLSFFHHQWLYVGQYPRFRAGRTYPRLELLDLLHGKFPYVAFVEAFINDGSSDPSQVLLTFMDNMDSTTLHDLIKRELGDDFLPDKIENITILPKLNDKGGADQKWCQTNYQIGELYRRERSPIHRCISELKQIIIAVN